MRFFRELDPFASHVAVAALAIATWVFLIVPLWRRWRPRLLLLSKNNLLKKRLAAATIVFLVFAVGLWAGWHKDAISARLSRWHSELTRTIPSRSPSPSPLTLTESPVEPMAQTPASWPSLVDQLLREGIELRDRGDTTNAIERFQEALDSEPKNAAVLAELANTYDLMQLYDRANEMWRKLQEMGPSAGAAYELADRRLKLGMPTPAAAPMPTAPDSSSREVSPSPYGTAADFAKYAIKPREHEIDQVPPLPTSTASEVSSPATRASPAEPGPSAETAVAQPGGRLIVLRAPNFGWNLALNLKIDGRTAANIVPGRRYDHFVPGASYADRVGRAKLSADVDGAERCGADKRTYSRQHGRTRIVLFLFHQPCLQATPSSRNGVAIEMRVSYAATNAHVYEVRPRKDKRGVDLISAS